MGTIKHRAETPIPPEKGDTVPTSISSEIFQQRGAIVACKINSSPLIGIFDIPQAEDSTTHFNMHCSNPFPGGEVSPHSTGSLEGVAFLSSGHWRHL